MRILSGKALRPTLLHSLEQDPLLSSLSFLLVREEDGADAAAYLAGIEKTLSSLKIPYEELLLRKEESEQEAKARLLSQMPSRMVILAQPLLSSHAVLTESLPALQDPDMQTLENLGRLASGDLGYLPATAQAVHYLLDAYSIDLAGKKVLVLGRSNVVGKPLSLLALKEAAFVSVAHSKVPLEKIRSEAKESDVLFLATGKEGLLRKEDLKKGAIVVDCGFHDGKGDLGFVPDEEDEISYTPVPGGVGALTRLMVVKNALFLLRKSLRKN